MNENDVTQAVKQAIVQARGDTLAAVGLLMAAAAHDEKLLRALVAPHLHAILNERVVSVMRDVKARKGGASQSSAAPAASKPLPAAKAPPAAKGVDEEAVAPEPPRRRPPPPPTAAQLEAERREAEERLIDRLFDRLADEMPRKPLNTPRAPDGRPMSPDEVLSQLGRDPNGPPPPKAGPRHQAAIQNIARSFKKF